MVKKRNALVFLILGIFLTATFSGCTFFQPPVEEPPIGNDEKQEYDIVLYFGDSQAEYLHPELHTVEFESEPDSVKIAQQIVNELIAGPIDDNLIPTIPPGTKLLSLVIEDEIAYVDFSEELKTNHWGGSAGETMTITSITNSLTELEAIGKVQILIDGEKQESLAGHWDIQEPLDRDPLIIKEK